MIDTILKLFFPYEKIQLSTDKDIHTVKNLIDDNHSSFTKTFPYVDKSKLFLGDRKENRFKLYKPFYFLRPVAVITGSLEEKNEGTRINLNIRSSAFHFSGLLLVLVLSLIIIINETPEVMMLKLPVMLVLYFLLYFLFLQQAQKAKAAFQGLMS